MKKRLALFGIWFLCLLCAVISLVWYLTAIVFGPDRAWKIALGYDQLGNTAFGNDEDETISSMSAKAARKRKVWWAVVICWVLEKTDPAHVRQCFANEHIHAEAINALSTTEEVKTYNYTTGWAN